jgi:hypothetical protein
MADASELEDLIGYLVRASRLTPAEAARLVDDVLNFLHEEPDEFVCRRHRELQREALPNAEIFARIIAEMGARRFRAPVYSIRQIRRIIYG